jgi:hypothetical protein
VTTGAKKTNPPRTMARVNRAEIRLALRSIDLSRVWLEHAAQSPHRHPGLQTEQGHAAVRCWNTLVLGPPCPPMWPQKYNLSFSGRDYRQSPSLCPRSGETPTGSILNCPSVDESSWLTQKWPRGGSLRRVITVCHAVAIYVSSVLGAGILVTPGLAARTAGAGSLFAWAFLALASYPFAFTFSTLSARRPESGGIYSFAKEAFGHGVATMTAWLFVAWVVLGAPAITLAAGTYLAYAFPISGTGSSLRSESLRLPMRSTLGGSGSAGGRRSRSSPS